MHNPEPQETVTPLNELSAVDLIAGYRAKQFTPSEVLEDVLARVAVWDIAANGAFVNPIWRNQ